LYWLSKADLIDELLELLISIVRVFRKGFCGWECNVSELGWVDYVLLIVFFFIVFFLTRKIINYFTKLTKDD